MKKLFVISTLLMLVVSLTACGVEAEVTQLTTTERAEMSRAELLAHYGITELNIGLVMLDDNPEAGRANENFRLALEEYIGIPVNEIEGISHLVGLEAMRGGSIDMFFASPFTYLTGALNIDDLDLEFLAAVHNPDAAPGGTLIVANANHAAANNIQTIADFEGESFAFVDTASMTGFLLPMYEFVSTLNRDHAQMLNPGYFFSNTILSGQHDASLMAVANGDVAGAAVASLILDMFIENGIIETEDVVVIDQIVENAPAGYIVRSELPQFLIDDLRSFFLGFDDEDYFANIQGSPNSRFVESNPADFNHLRSLMQTLEIGQ